MTTEIETRQSDLKKGPATEVENLDVQLVIGQMEAELVAQKAEDRKRLTALSAQGVITKEFESALMSFKERYYSYIASELAQTKAAMVDIVHALEVAIHDASETLLSCEQSAITLLREEKIPPPEAGGDEGLVFLHEFRVRAHGLEHLIVLYKRDPGEVVNGDVYLCSIDDLLEWVDYDFLAINAILQRVVRQQEQLDNANNPRLEYI